MYLTYGCEKQYSSLPFVHASLFLSSAFSESHAHHTTASRSGCAWEVLKRSGLYFVTRRVSALYVLFRCSLYPACNYLILHLFTEAQSKLGKSYVYWTVHHLDSWIKGDQLGVTCFIISLFNAQHISDVNTSILRRLRLICWVISWVVLLWFDVCWCYVVVWLGWWGWGTSTSACIRKPHQHSQTTT